MNRDALVAALGSAIISGLIAFGMGTVYRLDTLILMTLVLLSALGGALFGYRSRLDG